MKIDNGSLPQTPDRVGITAGVTSTEARRPAATGSGRASDAVAVSGEAQLLAAAVGHVKSLGEIRPEVVDRAREAIARGEVGADADRLADRLIDGLLNRALEDE